VNLLVAIPSYGGDLHEAGRALSHAVEKVRAVTAAPVHVFHAPGRKPLLPEGITAHAVALLPEADSALPQGWFTAVTSLAHLSPRCAVLVVNPWNPRLSSDRVGQAVVEMLKISPPALLSTVQCADHPCQWEEYFDIIDSQAYTLVDADDGGVGELTAKELGLGLRVHASVPFGMPSSGPWPQTKWEGQLFEWLPEEGVLRGVYRAIGGQSGLAPEHRVFLWHEGGAVVRQVAFCEEDLAALPLFRPLARAEACFLRRNKDLWSMGLSPSCSRVERCQVFPVPSLEGSGDATGSMAFRPVRLGSRMQVSGRTFLAAATIPQQTGPLFLLNALAPAALPQADISLPFHSAHSGWIVDPLTMQRHDRVKGDPIMGRQGFPEVMQMEGSLLGLSAEFAGDPLAALLGVGKVLPLPFEESEMAPRVEPPLLFQPLPIEREAEPTPSSRRADALLDGVRTLRGEIQQVRTDGKSGAPRIDALSHLGKAIELLADIRREHAALALERDTVVAQVRDYDERSIDLLPLRIYMQHQSKSLRGIPPDLAAGVLDPLVDALLAAGADSMEEADQGISGTTSALEAMRGHAVQLGLHPCWASGLPLALARRGEFREALDILREAYALKPWLRDEYARIGVTCFRPQFRFNEYLFWMDQDALAGRMSPSWLYHYCEAMAVCRQEERAERVADAAYAVHPSLSNLHAVTAWWRFTIRDFCPASALSRFEKDSALGRINGEFVLQYAQILAALGELDRACELVERVYASDLEAANGFAMVGWFYHMVLRRNSDEVIALFQRDLALNRLNVTCKSFLAAAYAYKDELKTAQEIVAELYAESSAFVGCMATIGLMRWLRARDIEAALDYFGQDSVLGRLPGIDMRLIHLAFLCLAGRGDSEDAVHLRKTTPSNGITWDVVVARLKWMGFRDDEVSGLITPALRALCSRDDTRELSPSCDS